MTTRDQLQAVKDGIRNLTLAPFPAFRFNTTWEEFRHAPFLSSDYSPKGNMSPVPFQRKYIPFFLPEDFAQEFFDHTLRVVYNLLFVSPDAAAKALEERNLFIESVLDKHGVYFSLTASNLTRRLLEQWLKQDWRHFAKWILDREVGLPVKLFFDSVIIRRIKTARPADKNAVICRRRGNKNDRSMKLTQSYHFLLWPSPRNPGEYIFKQGQGLSENPSKLEWMHVLASFFYRNVDKIGALGRETGSCMLCGRALTDEFSVKMGIGPVCLNRAIEDWDMTPEELDEMGIDPHKLPRSMQATLGLCGPVREKHKPQTVSLFDMFDAPGTEE